VQFSVVIPKITKREETWLGSYLSRPDDEELKDEKKLNEWMDHRGNPYDKLDSEEPEFWPHFNWEVIGEEREKSLWIYSDEDGNIDSIGHVIQKFLQEFRPNDCFHMEWASICSKLRADAFNGGAIFVTAEEVKWTTTQEWVSEQLELFQKKGAPSAQIHPG
jgi:hypothetical protein